MTFDVTSHPLLSASATALLAADAPAFRAQARAAELVLTITAGALGIENENELDADVRDQARLAVVRQMARDLANKPDEDGLSMQRRGERQVQYFAGRYDRDRAVDLQAKLLADAVIAAVLGGGTETPDQDDTPWAVARTLR